MEGGKTEMMKAQEAQAVLSAAGCGGGGGVAN